jgi:hypothetical protein
MRSFSQDEFDRRTNVGGQGVFDHASEGVELQVTANATKNWRFQVNYALTDAVEENLFNEWKNWHARNLQYLSKFDLRTSRRARIAPSPRRSIFASRRTTV